MDLATIWRCTMFSSDKSLGKKLVIFIVVIIVVIIVVVAKVTVIVIYRRFEQRPPMTYDFEYGEIFPSPSPLL